MKKMTGLKNWWTAGVTVLIGAMLFAVPAAAATGVNVTAHSKADIRSYIAANGPESTAVTYAVEPVTTAPYAPGRLSDETQLNALKQLNVIRYIAGLNHNVTLDASYSEMAQAGVLINAVNREMSHYPAQPADMDNALYQLGYNGTQSSNLGWNYSTLVDAINSYLSDPCEPLYVPTLEEKLDVMVAHVAKMVAYKGEYIALRQARKLVVGYFKGVRGAASLRNDAGKIETMDDLIRLKNKALGV